MLKMKMPHFNGDILRWADFWVMFNARLKLEPHLTDMDKGTLLVEAITEPEAHRRAEAAVANSATFAESSTKIRAEYECPKTLFRHHYETAFRSDHFKDTREDISRLREKIDASVRGFEVSSGFTASQILAHTWGQMLAPSLLKQWRLHTKEDKNPPTIDALCKFLDAQKEAAPDHRLCPTSGRSQRGLNNNTQPDGPH